MPLSFLNLKNELADASHNITGEMTKIDIDGLQINLPCPMATRTRLALMNLSAVNGGAACHWGGPSALVEMMTVVHNEMFKNKDWYNKYNFVNDVGHGENGIYALRSMYDFDNCELQDLLGFRSIESKLTGHGESHLNPQGVLLSNGPLGSSLGQAQGLAMADKAVSNDRTTICVVSDGASMEGEAKEAFAAIGGFGKKDKINPFIMILSDNNTKLSGRISDDSFEMSSTYANFENLGWNIIKVENGHGLEDCYKAFNQALNLSKTKPTLIWLKTIKGYPVKSAMESASGAHGFPIKSYSEDILSFIDEINKGNTPSHYIDVAKSLLNKPDSDSSSIKKEKMQAGFAIAAIEMKNAGFPVVSVSSDLQGSTGMAPFHKECSDAAFDVGIAESNMVSVAAGMSKAGLIPIVDTFAAFGVTKGNLPHIMASLSDCPMIAIYSHTGFQDAADGASHQSTTYISAMSSIPHTKVIVVSSKMESYELLKEAIKDIADKRQAGKKANSYIFFVGRESFIPQIKEGLDYKLGIPQLLKSGSKALVVSCGALVHNCLDAASKLSDESIDVSVINLSSINFGDLDLVKNELLKSKTLITVEDHQLIGGMGAQLVHRLKQDGVEFNLKSIAINGQFGRSAYNANQLYDYYSIGTKNIIDAVKQI
ncbi:MAG: thiamine pyrophosphate-dependent enzyme [Bacteriovoracaceae bacterium]|nr:thiamine pyrophosphate-dependent enzyme [Bacteriovoracaceae bacterium]